MKRMVNVATLHSALESERDARSLSWMQVAQQSGVRLTVLARVGEGREPDLDALVALAGWLGRPVETFVVDVAAEREENREPELISSYLTADDADKPGTTDAFQAVFRSAYAQISGRG